MTDAAMQVPKRGELRRVDVFVGSPGGGNPVPFVADAQGMEAAQMLQVARDTGHESAFVLPPADAPAEPAAGGAHWRLRFFVPQHEMEMCGHATVGTLWALRQWGLWTTDTARVETHSGLVEAMWDTARRQVWISQPRAQVQVLPAEHRGLVARALGLPPEAAALPALPAPSMANASTSRVKTLVALPTVEALQALSPDFAAMEAVCTAIGSTGLYPYAFGDAVQDAHGGATVFARQFPRSSGYPEDAATGIAAAALWGHLGTTGAVPLGTQGQPVTCTVRQGDAMGRPSAIAVRPRFDTAGGLLGCWLGGRVEWSSP